MEAFCLISRLNRKSPQAGDSHDLLAVSKELAASCAVRKPARKR
jgi:hypothetical protein